MASASSLPWGPLGTPSASRMVGARSSAAPLTPERPVQEKTPWDECGSMIWSPPHFLTLSAIEPLGHSAER